MIYLLLSILFSSLLYAILKCFKKFNINTLHAIITNYFVAFSSGFLLADTRMNIHEVVSSSWFFGALLMGILFILVFNIMGITAQISGVAVASVASKMSVVIPIIFGLIVYQESAGVLKIIGILLAITSVYLTSIKSKIGFKWRNLLYPALLFLGSGAIDTSLKYMETQINTHQITHFSITVFGFAGTFGLLYILISRNNKIQWRSILGGIVLGIPNYFSLIFLLKALGVDGMESSTLFTINNVSVVLFTTFIGIFFFKEKLLSKNWVGILLALVSILLVIYT